MLPLPSYKKLKCGYPKEGRATQPNYYPQLDKKLVHAIGMMGTHTHIPTSKSKHI